MCERERQVAVVRRAGDRGRHPRVRRAIRRAPRGQSDPPAPARRSRTGTEISPRSNPQSPRIARSSSNQPQIPARIEIADAAGRELRVLAASAPGRRAGETRSPSVSSACGPVAFPQLATRLEMKLSSSAGPGASGGELLDVLLAHPRQPIEVLGRGRGDPGDRRGRRGPGRGSNAAQASACGPPARAADGEEALDAEGVGDRLRVRGAAGDGPPGVTRRARPTPASVGEPQPREPAGPLVGGWGAPDRGPSPGSRDGMKHQGTMPRGAGDKRLEDAAVARRDLESHRHPSRPR